MRKILIVEDEKNIILSLKMLLIKEGFVVKVATNGVDAIKEAQDFMPNLIFLDIVLPKMNGYLVCEALKDNHNTRHIPIVFTSAKTQEEDIKKAYNVGGSEYVVKPFTPKEIKELLNKYFEEE